MQPGNEKQRMDVPAPDTYWVEPGRLLAGRYPDAITVQAVQEGIERFLAAGVTFFLDLTYEWEGMPYAQWLDGRAEYRRCTIVDFGVPSPQEMTAILDVLDAALAAGRVVYLHCWGGVGRTGTVVGCYLVRHGMRGEEALAALDRLRVDVSNGWLASPETVAQREMVLTWQG